METEKSPLTHVQTQAENVQSDCGLAVKRPKPTENLMCARGNRIFRAGYKRREREGGKVNESVKSHGNQ